MDTVLNMMRRNQAHKLIFRDRIEGNPMEARVVKIEVDVLKIQVEMGELRADMKAANQSIADLKSAVATVDGKVDAASARLDGKIDALGARLDGRVDALSERVDSGFDAVNERIDKLDAKVDANHRWVRDNFSELGRNISDMRESIAALRESIGDVKGSQRILILVMSGAGAFGLMAEAFHWI